MWAVSLLQSPAPYLLHEIFELKQSAVKVFEEIVQEKRFPRQKHLRLGKNKIHLKEK